MRAKMAYDIAEHALEERKKRDAKGKEEAQKKEAAAAAATAAATGAPSEQAPAAATSTGPSVAPPAPAAPAPAAAGGSGSSAPAAAAEASAGPSSAAAAEASAAAGPSTAAGSSSQAAADALAEELAKDGRVQPVAAASAVMKQALASESNPIPVLEALPHELLRQLPALLGQTGLLEAAYQRAATVIKLLVSAAHVHKPFMLVELQHELQT